MQERDVLDLLLVAVLSVVTYVETFGIADPVATLDEIVGVLASIDVTVYVVLGGLLGIFFLAYLTIYLPKQNAARSIR